MQVIIGSLSLFSLGVSMLSEGTYLSRGIYQILVLFSLGRFSSGTFYVRHGGKYPSWQQGSVRTGARKSTALPLEVAASKESHVCL